MSPGRPAARRSPYEALPVPAAGVAAGWCVVVYAAGQLTGRLFGGAWPDVAATDVIGIALRLPAHAGDPAAAWPEPARALLPGPVALYVTMALVAVVGVVAAVAVAVLAQRFRDRPGRKTRRGEPQPASWATSKDLKPLRVDRATRGRLVIGKVGRHLIATEQRHSLIVLGPTQTGKTTGLAIPALLEWDGPVIATSVKTDLLDDTYAWRSTQGETWVYDPTASTGGDRYPLAQWTPLSGCTTWAGAVRTATWLAEAGRDGAGFGDADFWYANAAKLLAPLLFAAATSDRTMSHVVAWLDTQEIEEVRFELELAGVPEALNAAEASWNREERQRSSVYTTAETVLRAFADPAVAGSALRSDVTADRLLDGKSHTLYICAPSHEQGRLRPLFSALLGQLISSCYNRAASNGRLDSPLLIVLDEAANIAPLRDLDQLASTAAGIGVQLVTVWQDLAQVRARYGQRCDTVVNNHRAKLVLSGISDRDTLEYVSRLTGETEVTRENSSTSDDGQRTTTRVGVYRQLAPTDALRQLLPGSGLLLYGHLAPVRLRLRAWYADKALRHRSERGPLGGRAMEAQRPTAAQ